MKTIKTKIIGKNSKDAKILEEHIKKIFDSGYTYDNKK
jgi:hypothetical protein